MKRFVLFIIMLAVLAPAVALMAQSSSSPMQVEGTVVTSSGDQLVIQTSSGDRQAFHVDAGSQVPASLAAGDRVRVKYIGAAEAGMHVAEVVLIPSSEPVSPSRPATSGTSSAASSPRSPDPSGAGSAMGSASSASGMAADPDSPASGTNPQGRAHSVKTPQAKTTPMCHTRVMMGPISSDAGISRLGLLACLKISRFGRSRRRAPPVWASLSLRAPEQPPARLSGWSERLPAC